MKKVVLLLVTILLLGGCTSKKEAITSDTYKTKMEQANYEIKDVTVQTTNNNLIKKIYVAVSKDKFYQIEFYELTTAEYANNFYDNYKNIFKNSKTENSKENEILEDSYSNYTLETTDKYKIVIKIDNTVLFADVDLEFKDKVNDTIKELGY